MKTDFRRPAAARPAVLFSRVISRSARHTAVDGGTSRNEAEDGENESSLSREAIRSLIYLS